MVKEKNRLRDKQLNIRVTDYEYQLIKERMEKAGSSSLREFVVEAAINGFLINVDYSDLKSLTYEINKIGTNINQIAHKINAENAVYKSQMNEIQEDINLIWKMLRTKFYHMP